MTDDLHSDDSRIKTSPGRIAAIDYGTVRVGIAISDPDRILASPLENYQRRSSEHDANHYRQLVEEQDIVLFVVGLPVHLDGRESQKSAEARRYAAWLQDVTKVPYALFDERFTSAAAERLLMAANLTKKRRKARTDMLAAHILLAAYLEAGCPLQAPEHQSLDE